MKQRQKGNGRISVDATVVAQVATGVYDVGGLGVYYEVYALDDCLG
jgi:hypothetical protein